MVARPIKQIPSPNDAVTEGRGRGAMGLRGPMAGQGEGASLHPSIGHRLGSIEHTFMMLMTLDHVGDQEAIVYVQLGQQRLARTTETSLEMRAGTRSCLSAQPPALAFWTGTRPQVCLLYTSPSPRDGLLSRMPSSA